MRRELKKNIFKIRTNVIIIIFCIYSFLGIFTWSEFSKKIPQLAVFFIYLQMLMVSILMIIYLLGAPKINDLFICFGLIGFSIVCSIITKDIRLLMFIAFFYAARNIDYKKVLKYAFWTDLLSFFIIFCAYRIGYLSNYIVVHGDGKLRQSLGFNYPTYPMYVLLIICIEYIIFTDNISYLSTLLMLIITFYFSNLTDARGEFYALLIILIGVIVDKVKGIKRLLYLMNNSINKKIIILLPEFFAVISFFVVMYLNPGSLLYFNLNKLFSFRLEIFKYFYDYCGLHLWPMHINVAYIMWNTQITVIDNLYLSLGLNLGIIALAIYCFITSVLIENAMYKKSFKLLVIIISFVFLNLVESQTIAPFVALYVLTYESRDLNEKNI